MSYAGDTRHSQTFTTGSNPHGYEVTSIGLNLRATANKQLTVTLRRGSEIGSVVATFRSQGEGQGVNVHEFTTTKTVYLAFDAEYVIRFNESRSNDAAWAQTTSSAEDSSGARGWSIANDGFLSGRYDVDTYQIRVNGHINDSTPAGYDLARPKLSRLAAVGNKLTLTYNETLDGTSVPEGDNFIVVSYKKGESTTDWLVPVTGVRVIGSRVILTLSRAVRAGETVTVSYKPIGEPGDVPIQDLAGNWAARLTDLEVEDVSTADKEGLKPTISTRRPPTTYRENGTSVIYTFRAIDPQRQTIAWSLGGDDAGDFDLSDDGALTFRNTPDFEDPTDSDRQNDYELTVIATDEDGYADRLFFTVTVTDVNEGPEISRVGSAPGSVPENHDPSLVLARYTATDPENPTAQITRWSTSGTDGGDFVIDDQGDLRFRSTPDYERPADSNRDNVYVFTVRAYDGRVYGYFRRDGHGHPGQRAAHHHDDQ